MPVINNQFSVIKTSSDAVGAALELLKRRSQYESVAASDVLGEITFAGSDGATGQVGAKIQVVVGGTPGAGDMPGVLIFLTTPDGSATPVESARVDANQNLIMAAGKRLETNEVRARDSGGLVLAEDGGLGLSIADSTGIITASNNVRLDIDQVRARDPGGLALYDDGGNGIFVKDGGFVGIGLGAPAALLHVEKTAVASAAEEVARFTISDDATAYLRIVNTTTADGVFGPGIETLHAGTGASRLDLVKITTDTGTTPALIYDARTVAGAEIITRPLFDWRTFGASRMIMLADGSVGIGTTAPSARLSVKAGTSTDHANVGGTLYVTTTQTGNIGTGEDDVASFSVPANTLATDGDSLWFEASGTATNNANAKTLRVRFGTSGTTQVFSQAYTINVGGQWTLAGRVIRTGAATQKGYCAMEGNQVRTANAVTNLNQTLSGAVTLRVTVEAVSNNDLILETFVVGWSPNNT